jgi:DNA-binding response OmpR family regulator
MAKILIAEDEQDIRDLIEFTLRYVGHEVVAYSNGVEAWKQAVNDNPNLILLDVRMPVMSGIETCLKLKSDPRTMHIPVVFLSAKGQDSEIKAGLDAGAVEYILKPFAPEDLNNRLKKILERPS